MGFVLQAAGSRGGRWETVVGVWRCRGVGSGRGQRVTGSSWKQCFVGWDRSPVKCKAPTARGRQDVKLALGTSQDRVEGDLAWGQSG